MNNGKQEIGGSEVRVHSIERGDNLYIYNLKAVAKKLQIDYAEVTSHIGHMGEMGACREEILKRYLQQFLPEKFKVGRGFIIDSDGNQSRQQDFIIYDAFNSPKALDMENVQILPVESVFCTIEVKSTLNKAELEKSIENIRSVRMLKPAVIHNMPIQPANTNRTIGLVFAYTSDTSIETVLDNFYEINKTVELDKQISLICILDKGLILRSENQRLGNVSLYPHPNTTLGYSPNSLETNFYLFCLLLINTLNHMTNLPPSLMEYAMKQGALNIQSQYPQKYMPENRVFGFGEGISVSSEYLSGLPKVQKKMQLFQQRRLSKDDLLELLFIDLQKVALPIIGENSFQYNPTDFPGINIGMLNQLYHKKMSGELLSLPEKELYDSESELLYMWHKN